MRAKWAQRMMAAMAIAGTLMGAGQAADFVAGFDDLPMMTALSEIPEAAVTFDTAAGRIVIAVAEGRADRRLPLDLRAANPGTHRPFAA